MRLNETYVKAIYENTLHHFGEGSRVLLFGSRVDDSKRGGDIDLYIIPDVSDDLYRRKIKFLVALQMALGEQKIDVVIARDSSRLIEQEALEKGIEL